MVMAEKFWNFVFGAIIFGRCDHCSLVLPCWTKYDFHSQCRTVRLNVYNDPAAKDLGGPYWGWRGRAAARGGSNRECCTAVSWTFRATTGFEFGYKPRCWYIRSTRRDKQSSFSGSCCRQLSGTFDWLLLLSRLESYIKEPIPGAGHCKDSQAISSSFFYIFLTVSMGCPTPQSLFNVCSIAASGMH